jgi:hypothetical protein
VWLPISAAVTRGESLGAARDAAQNAVARPAPAPPPPHAPPPAPPALWRRHRFRNSENNSNARPPARARGAAVPPARIAPRRDAR